MEVTSQARRALRDLVAGEHSITRTRAIEGRPGGPNNDCLELYLDDGRVLRVDAYAMSGIAVRIGKPMEAKGDDVRHAAGRR